MAITVKEHYTTSPAYRLFTVDFHGTEITTTVTSTPSVVRKWIYSTLFHYRKHRDRLVVGLGVQWTPYDICYYDQSAATIQLCVGRRCLIFQLHHSRTVPRRLRRFLLEENSIFVGMWNHSDEMKLRSSKHRLEMLRSPIDLREHTVDDDDCSLRGAPVEEIVREYLGLDMHWDDGISRSEWSAFKLSHGQVRQASLDAYASFVIGKQIRAWELVM